MAVVIAIYLLAVGAVIGLLVLWQAYRGKHELVSLRNLFLLGFVIFQIFGAIPALTTNLTARFPISDPVGTGMIYSAMVTVFVFVFLWAYNKGLGVKKIARALPTSYSVPSSATLWLCAVVVIVVAFALRFGVMIPYVGLVAMHVGEGAAAVAAGLACWVWGRRLFNPYAAMASLAIAAAASAIVMTGSFGRRGLVAVGACMLWGVYYGHLRYLPFRTMFWRLSALAVIPVIAIALFTAVRSAAEHDRTASEHLAAMRSGNVFDGLALLMSGQDAGNISMWLIETHPERFEPRHLFTLYFMAVYPVPRDWWPEKPQALAQLVPYMAKMKGVPLGKFTVGPGVIGHAAAEGGWYALLIYAAFLGALIRLFDELVVINPYSPFIAAAVPAAAGQVLGLPRGETSSFAFLFVLGVTSNWLLLVLIAKALDRTGLTQPVALGDHEGDGASPEWHGDDGAHADDDQASAWYGAAERRNEGDTPALGQS